jgi:putative ABC transport system substrate-binding protein
MDRRAFIAGLACGTITSIRAAPARSAPRVYRIGILSVVATGDLAGPKPPSPYGVALLRGLSDRGYAYGRDFVTEHRGAEGRPERYPVLASELVRLSPDVIVAAGPALPALKTATATIPVVMAAAIDPVAEGLVQTLGRPGTNFTGLSHQIPETSGKRLELLKELVPAAGPVAVLWDRGSQVSWNATNVAARERGWRLLSLEIDDPTDIEGAFKAATEAGATGLLVLTGQIAFPHRKRIVELAASSKLPAVYDLRPYAEAGGLMSHGANLLEIWYQAASFVDRILKGAKAADLPIEQPTKFELVINQRAAKLIGLTIPQSILLQANEIIR